MPRIAVLIPCWNEALTIEKVVTDFRAVLPEADIYVYDNNSTDGTAEIAKRAGAIVVHEYRQGKGNVIRSMFRDIEADCYVMTDGDDKFQGLVRCFCMMKRCTNPFEPSERIEPAEPANSKLSTINKIFHFRYK